jgi:hypothetical protein
MPLPSFKKQNLLLEFARLRYAELNGVFVSITPGDPALWVGVIFVRKGMACCMALCHTSTTGIHIDRSIRTCCPKISDLIFTQLSHSAASCDLLHRCLSSAADTAYDVHVHDWIVGHRHRQRNR